MFIENEEFFTPQELDAMIEALTKWESRDIFHQLTGDVFKNMVPPEGRKEYENFVQQEEERLEQERKLRVERSIMMKAKLLKLRDKLAVDSLS